MHFNLQNLLKENKSVRKFASGEVIVREGDPGSRTYVVIRGDVGLYKRYGTDKPVLISEIGPDGVLGEEPLFLNGNPTATAIALGDVLAVELIRETAYHFFEKEPDAALVLIHNLCQRLEDLSLRYAETQHEPSPLPVPAVSPAPAAKAQPAAKSAPTMQVIKASPPDAPVSEDKQAAPRQTPAQADEPNAAPKQPAAASAPQAAGEPELFPPNVLFPPGHKKYAMPETEEDPSLLSEGKYTCTLCQHSFDAKYVRTVKLQALDTDPDLRKHFRGIEPMHYLTLTCPRCYFSAIRAQFNTTTSFERKILAELLVKYRQEMNIDFTGGPSATHIFASLYLTMVCTPYCSRKAASVLGYLWLNTSWMYRDCQDEEMEHMAMIKACESYEKAYRFVRMEKDVEQQVCLILGQLKFKLGDNSAARKYLFEAKTNKFGSRVLSDMAEDIIDTLRRQSTG